MSVSVSAFVRLFLSTLLPLYRLTTGINNQQCYAFFSVIDVQAGLEARLHVYVYDDALKRQRQYFLGGFSIPLSQAIASR